MVLEPREKPQILATEMLRLAAVYFCVTTQMELLVSKDASFPLVSMQYILDLLYSRLYSQENELYSTAFSNLLLFKY